ncbi:MAG: hypothetical protein ACU0GG_14675 [Paracoccaceae bacterium]
MTVLTFMFIWHTVIAMDITESKPSRLVLEHVPWARGVLLIVSVFAGAALGLSGLLQGQNSVAIILIVSAVFGGFYFTMLIERRQVLFLRDDNALILRRKSVHGYHEEHHALSSLSHAEIESYTIRSFNKVAHTILVMEDGRLPLTPSNMSRYEATFLAKAINEWLAPDS